MESRVDLARSIVREWLETGPSERGPVAEWVEPVLAGNVLVTNGTTEIKGRDAVVSYLAGHDLLGSSRKTPLPLPAEWADTTEGDVTTLRLVSPSPFGDYGAQVTLSFVGESLIERMEISFPHNTA